MLFKLFAMFVFILLTFPSTLCAFFLLLCLNKKIPQTSQKVLLKQALYDLKILHFAMFVPQIVWRVTQLKLSCNIAMVAEGYVDDDTRLCE